jgi:hypothetical protein
MYTIYVQIETLAAAGLRIARHRATDVQGRGGLGWSGCAAGVSSALPARLRHAVTILGAGRSRRWVGSRRLPPFLAWNVLLTHIPSSQRDLVRLDGRACRTNSITGADTSFRYRADEREKSLAPTRLSGRRHSAACHARHRRGSGKQSAQIHSASRCRRGRPDLDDRLRHPESRLHGVGHLVWTNWPEDGFKAALQMVEGHVVSDDRRTWTLNFGGRTAVPNWRESAGARLRRQHVALGCA